MMWSNRGFELKSNREIALEAFIMRLHGDGDLAMFCSEEVSFLAKKMVGVTDNLTTYEQALQRMVDDARRAKAS
ncbi:hypothetical protein PQQ84_18830 [Paraburkholderia strydomiana]|uniref:hypothetical protein n=1 Tax=Paraburkholderia strydomiana TaxID=1245417 RepID=UPI0038B89B88